MKIQYLAVIFILIIMPIIIVFNTYMDTQLTLVNTEALYDERLLNSTYDAMKAFQLNTINTTYYTPQTRVNNIDAAVNVFHNSLITSFKYDGNRADVMKEFVPAVVFTLYDGYYLYAPFKNTLTGLNLDTVDDEYKDGENDGKVLSDLRPYVSYTCKYHYNDKDYVITYSMDNYIVVDVFDGSKHYRKDGYLLDVKKTGNNKYQYNGIEFTKLNCIEKLSETLPETQADGSINGRKYYYTVKDGTKYYYDGDNNTGNVSECNKKDKIFYISNNGTRVNQVNSYENNEERFEIYYNEIMNNIAAYNYYKEAYEFTNWLLTDEKVLDVDGDGNFDTGENLSELTINNIKDISDYPSDSFTDVEKIFDNIEHIEESDSNFNRHRSEVIRAVITTNLSRSIAGFKNFSSSDEEFLMPKISETDWELLENNICIATFLQGFRVGGKVYNSYSVIPNNFNKEYVDENDIYMITQDNTYARPNEKNLVINSSLEYKPGVLKINLERRSTSDGLYYNPLSPRNRY